MVCGVGCNVRYSVQCRLSLLWVVRRFLLFSRGGGILRIVAGLYFAIFKLMIWMIDR